MSDADFTPLQEAILYAKYHNPTLTHKQVARKCDCSKEWVSEVVSEYDPQAIESIDNPTTPGDIDRNYTQPEDRNRGEILIALICGYLAGRALGWW